CAYVTGTTFSSNFPLKNPFPGSKAGYYDAFVTKLSTDGNSLIYSTYLGGSYDDIANGLAVDTSGFVYVMGLTGSINFPLQSPFQESFAGAADAFVTKLSPDGNFLVYSTYLGGDSYDWAYGLAVDGSGNAYVTGETESSDFPLQNPFQGSFAGGYGDAFVTKLSWTPDYHCGDVNTDEQIDLRDAVFLINYIFVSGPAPQSLSLADVNCSGSINIADVVRLINYIFAGGPAPCAACK
ncbi:MAG: SBBP repeat-containing protein, partial [candidate division Zixibacteria bacterium]|nr:SBBP repeat-containing protein [candidate division Zixibacteria bacterium]